MNIQRIEYGLPKINQTAQETKFTLFDLQEIKQVTVPPASNQHRTLTVIDEMMTPAGFDCNDR